MGKKRHNRIAAVLAEKHITIRDLARRLGRREASVSCWCTNDVQPQLNTFAKIADVLDVDIRELFVKTRE